MDRLEHLLRERLRGTQQLDADEILAAVAHRRRLRRARSSVLVAGAVLAIIAAASANARLNQATLPAHPPTAAPTVSPAPSTTEAEPSPTVTASPRPTITTTLVDGRYFAEVTAADLANRRVTFDVMQWLTGAAAHEAWRDRNPQDPDGPPNDYFIINDNLAVRTMPVSAGVRVRIVDMNNIPDSVAIAFDTLPAAVAQRRGLFWLTVVDGQITAMDEQYTP